MKENMVNMGRRGLMLVLSSPSGAGKTSIAKKLLETDKNLSLSVSVTTRAARKEETHGKDYNFISQAEFNQLIEKNQLLEYAQIFENYYGTLQAPVETALGLGKDVLFDIDWRGTQQLSETSRGDLVTVFILPPSWSDLEKRLFKRAQDSETEIQKRMSKASEEISHWAEYDYVIVNEDFEQSVNNIKSILAAERLKRRRQTGLSEFVKGLQK
ncbi:MAG: guanylate kinase [Alphaproteobacteria bacterium]|nr:guanylate kinase [Alphaproteobacteria bacterium]MCL2505547.1 guanylate kinase [Alphaproteobacteria bacterium]